MAENRHFGWALLIVWLLAAAASLLDQGQPNPAQSDADLTVFSSFRAYDHVSRLSNLPRVVGSTEHRQAEEYILNALQNLGLNPEIQEASVERVRSARQDVTRIRNIIAVLPGSDSAQTMLVGAHHDTVANSPGAGDNAAAVASVLETIRALKTSPPLKHDIIFLFADGEEWGLRGARAFVEQHPLAESVDVVYNVDGRGNSGPSLLFETTLGDYNITREYARSAPNPVGSALATAVYQMMPNTTDFNHYKLIPEVQGLNNAHIGGPVNYHAATDTPERLSLKTLQHQGVNLLGFARHFGSNTFLKSDGEQAIFGSFPLIGLIHLKPWWRWVFIATALLLLTLSALNAMSEENARKSFINSIVLTPIALAANGVLINGLWMLLKIIEPGGTLELLYFPYDFDIYFYAVMLISAGASIVLLRLMLKVIEPAVLITTIFSVLFCLCFVRSEVTPALSLYFMAPLSFIILAWLVVRAIPLKDRYRSALLVLSGIPMLFSLAPTSKLLIQGLSADLFFLSGILVFFITAPLTVAAAYAPSLERIRIPVFMVFSGILLLAFAVWQVRQPSVARPFPNSLSYGLDLDSSQAVWFSNDKNPGPWIENFIKNTQRSKVKNILVHTTRDYLMDKAPVIQAQPAMATIIEDSTEDDIRTLKLQISSSRKAVLVRMHHTGADIITMELDGHALDPKTPTTILNGLFDGQAELVLQFPSGQNPELTLVDLTYGLPEQAGPRPPEYIPFKRGLRYLENATLVKKTYSFPAPDSP